MYNYLFSDRTGFNGAAWIATLVWLFALGIGIYLFQVWRERNPIRARFVRQFGLGLTVVSAVGLVLLILKSLSIPIVDWRIWSYATAALTVLLLIWGAWYNFSRLPQLLAAARQPVGRSRSGARTYSTAGTAQPAAQRAPAPPKPVATTGRREARREKKRKSR